MGGSPATHPTVHYYCSVDAQESGVWLVVPVGVRPHRGPGGSRHCSVSTTPAVLEVQRTRWAFCTELSAYANSAKCVGLRYGQASGIMSKKLAWNPIRK